MRIAYRKCLISIGLGLIALAASGCAEKVTWPSWPFSPPKPDPVVQNIRAPAERIEELRKLADQASYTKPEDRQRVSSELVTAISFEEDPVVRAESIRTLMEYPSPGVDNVLSTGLKDTNAEVRIVSCRAWGRRGGPEAARALGEVLSSDTNIDVRLAAARALGEVKDPGAISALAIALEDRDPAMQHRAVESLRKVVGQDLGNDVNAWRQYTRGGEPQPPKKVSFTDRARQWF
jgi:HEAT repeat protein